MKTQLVYVGYLLKYAHGVQALQTFCTLFSVSERQGGCSGCLRETL